ncbi:MAG: copper resistance protein NlpE [Bacteroides sp.]|nr:copper resistance protein NlpE [Bacteroides sp.]MBD5306338.1 copper resistance protein NlpE [Bacteroides sp.]
MKKSFYVAAAAAFALTGLASCGGNKSCNNNCGSKQDKIEIYTGVLPAADCDGIRYTLHLDYDEDDNFMKGDYDLTETYLVSDSTSVGGVSDNKSFRSEGDFTVNNKAGKKYLRLVQDRKDSQQGSAEGPIYFLVENDSTLTLVNDDLQLPDAPGLNYSLKLSK